MNVEYAAFDCRGSLYGEQRHDCFSLFSSYFPAQLFHHRRQLLSPQRKLHLSGRLAAVSYTHLIEAGNSVDEELMNVIELIAIILGDLKGEDENGE